MNKVNRNDLYFVKPFETKKMHLVIKQSTFLSKNVADFLGNMDVDCQSLN